LDKCKLSDDTNELDGVAMTYAAMVCCYQEDLEKLQHCDFYPRMLLKLLADKAEPLRILLLALKSNFEGDIPDYVSRKLTPTTKKMIDDFLKERQENV